MRPTQERAPHSHAGPTSYPAHVAAQMAREGGGLHAEQVLALQRSAGNRAVQRFLAQDGAQSGSTQTVPLQRKMSWKHTDWGSAGYLNASSGGGGGVLFVGEEGREVVVKPGEELAAETALASMLINKVGRARRTRGEARLGKGMGKGGMNIVAPGTRLVAKSEASKMKTSLGPLVNNVESGKQGKEAEFRRARAAALVDKLDEPGVLVQDLAAGQELKEAIGVHEDQTEEDAEGGLQMKATSPLKIFRDSRSITALGRITAVDLFTGNKDRLVGLYNAENLMVSTTSVTAIDNIWMGSDKGIFQTTTLKGQAETDTARKTEDRTVTRDDALDQWKADPDVKSLAEGNFADISEKVFERVKSDATLQKGMSPKARRAAEGNFAAIMDFHKDFFLSHFAAGLKAGKKQLLASLDRLLRDKSQLKKLAPGVNLREVMDTVRKRKRFLQGKTD